MEFSSLLDMPIQDLVTSFTQGNGPFLQKTFVIQCDIALQLLKMPSHLTF